jgi:hypothetical protein
MTSMMVVDWDWLRAEIAEVEEQRRVFEALLWRAVIRWSPSLHWEWIEEQDGWC